MAADIQNLQEHTIQKNNMAMMDPTFLKLRLDTQKLHQDFLNFLSGQRTIVEYDQRTNTYFEKQEEIGKPRANPLGIQMILTRIIAVVNPHTIQGNTERKELYRILKNLEVSLAEDLTVNYDKWGIDPDDRDTLIETIMPMVHLILTRTVDNEERKGLGIGVEQIKTAAGTNKTKKSL